MCRETEVHIGRPIHASTCACASYAYVCVRGYVFMWTMHIVYVQKVPKVPENIYAYNMNMNIRI